MVVLLGIGVFNAPSQIEEMPQATLILWDTVGIPLIYGLVFFAVLGILGIVRSSYFQSSLIQMANRLMNDRLENEKPEDKRSFLEKIFGKKKAG